MAIDFNVASLMPESDLRRALLPLTKLGNPNAIFVMRVNNLQNKRLAAYGKPFWSISHSHKQKTCLRYCNLLILGKANRIDVPKGILAVYVGENRMKRFVIPGSYLNQPSFQELLSQGEEEFGFDHPKGALNFSCREDAFIDLISHLNV
ncbi:Small auxin-up RNA [Parasponia andersonii]|uniref:Small auxin-up RNA n=1 Tax=Parasponia andersonii TaxID=3476 RepID=A0A2P5ATE0_PARAD|nr:Small auxin-up RNA [Parasponia andersonii]